MPEKIDSLTLDIGLTSEEFQAGVNRILESMGRMESQAAETGESMGESFASLGSSVAGLAMRFAGMFIAVKGIEGLVDYFKDLSKELGNLGIAAEYLGQSSVELRRFGEVAELAGGQAHDAIAGVQGLESAIFGLEIQGHMSQNLMMLQRLGVAYLDASGHMRSFKDIVFETADALQRQLPGEANRAMRVQWAAQIFGPGGLANAVGGPVGELQKFYAQSVEDNKKNTNKTIDHQVALQRALIENAYQVKGEAAAILDKLTPAILALIKTVQTELIPTLDELISDIMAWLHPVDMLNKASEGPLGLTHPINDLAHFGAWLAGDARDWFENIQNSARRDTLDRLKIPAQVRSRMIPGSNEDAIKSLHLEAGGNIGDPTWSKALTTYEALSFMPGGPDAYVHSIFASGLLKIAPSAAPSASQLSTPSATRPSPPPLGTVGTPTASTGGPRIQIDSIGPIITQATDADGMMADINRAAARKLLVAQADPGQA